MRPLSRAVTPLWRWPSFFVLHLAVAARLCIVYFSGTDWSELPSTAGDITEFHGRRSIVSLASDLPLPSAAMKFETLYTVAAVATSERLSQQTVWCSRERRAIAHLEGFGTYGTVTDNVRGRDQRCKTADADEMRAKNSEIHTSLVTIHRWKTMRDNVSPNDNSQPSARVDHTSRHLTRWLAHTVGGGDE